MQPRLTITEKKKETSISVITIQKLSGSVDLEIVCEGGRERKVFDSVFNPMTYH